MINVSRFLLFAFAFATLSFNQSSATSVQTGVPADFKVSFVNIAKAAGLTHKTVYGDEHKNKYLLETTGCGVAWFDYDNDGWLDLFFVNGTRFGGIAKGQEPTNRLYRNNRNGTFTDVTEKAGLIRLGWGQAVCIGDYNNDGFDDLFVSYFGKNALYRNNGNGTFTDVSDKTGIRKTLGTYGLGVLVADFDNDTWPDIYVANDSAPATLYHNNGNGTFTDIGVESGAAYSGDGKPQAGMGVSAGDFDGDGLPDIFKTNFSGDTSTLYRNLGKNTFDDMTFTAGIGLNTRWLGWGCGFFDPDNDGWLDILLVNGHVYPEVEKLTTEAGYAQRKVLYRNMRNKSFQDVTEKIGGALMEPTPSRGCAFGDFDNDGDVDVVINTVNDAPVLMRLDTPAAKDGGNNWITVKVIGTKSNRTGIGARVKCTADDRAQITEVRSGGSYYSQNDLRAHFGVGKAAKATIEVRWPSGKLDVVKDAAVNQVIVIKEP